MKTFIKLITSLTATLSLITAPARMSFAQDSDQSPRASYLFSDGIVAPESPEAAAVAKYGDVAGHNLNTGAVGYSIPVYTYQDRDFTIPIALSYSSNGYKPNIQSGVMGLGWYPSTGWSVTREVCGIMDDAWPDLELYDFKHKNYRVSYPDDFIPDAYVYGYGFRYDPEAMQNPDITYIPSSILQDELVLQSKAGAEYLPVKWLDITGSARTQLCFENEPDVIRFNAPGGASGKFILRPNGMASFFDTNGPESAYSLSVTLERSGFTCFAITDAAGYKYTYAEADSNESWSLRGDSDNITSCGSWRITSVEAPSGRKMLFSYGVNTVSLNVMPSKTIEKNYRLGLEYLYGPDDYEEEDSMEHDYGGTWNDMNYSRTFSECLTGISVRNSDNAEVCSISFSYTAKARERGADAYGCWKLSGITVRNSLGRTVKSCALDYMMDYDPGRAEDEYDATGTGVTFLKSVAISGEGRYSFEYKDRATTTFPALGTWGVDWYGYWNPTVTSPNDFAPQSLEYCRQNFQTSPWLTSQRQAAPTYASKGLLERIDYPTGGWTTFSYEANSYSRDKSCLCSPSILLGGTASGLRIARISTFDSDGTELKRRDFSYVKEDGTTSSGELIWRPSIYTQYDIGGTQYYVLNREVMSTANDFPYSSGDFMGYLRVLESVYDPASPSDKAITEYVFSQAETGSCTTFTNPVSVIDSDSFGMVDMIWTCNISSYLPTGNLYAGLFNCQQGTMKGRLVSKTEYARNLSTPVMKTTYAEEEYGDIEYIDFKIMQLGFLTTERRFYKGVRAKGQTVEYYDSQDHESVIPVSNDKIFYDDLNRVSEIRSVSGTGGWLKTLFDYCEDAPALLWQKVGLRDSVVVSCERYEYMRPDTSRHPLWRVPWKAYSAEIEAPDSFSEEYLDCLRYRTEVTLGNYDAAGNPHSVTDAEGNAVSWDWSTQYGMMHPTGRTFRPAGQSGPELTTSWTWLPLVGPASQTGTSGKVSSYSYDAEGRLRSVQENGLVLKTMDYNVVNWNVPGSVTGLALPSGRNWTCITTAGDAAETGSVHDISYYDGLGYETQTHSLTTSGASTAWATSYDFLGRPVKQWLPYPCGAAYDDGFIDNQYEWYYNAYDVIEDADYPCSGAVMESAASGRTLSETMPGCEMADHPATYEYLTNTASEGIRLLSSDSESGALVVGGVYEPGSLSGVRTVDGDGRTVTVWTDMEGRTVREDRVISASETASTLYAYDWKGRLTWVIQPEGAAHLCEITVPSCEAASKWCFTYSYDGMNRIVEKRMPGKGRETFGYDDLDRMIYSRDALQESRNEHIEYSYDALGRETERRLVKETLSGSGPSRSVTLISSTYDGYPVSVTETPLADGVYIAGTAVSSPAGLLTKQTMAPLALVSLNLEIQDASYASRIYWYDSRERVVQSLELSPDGSSIRTSFQYDFQGNVLKRKETVTEPGGGKTESLLSEYTYDAGGRILTLARTLRNGNSTTVLDTVEYGYDELGRLCSKTVGDKITETYAYDLRGWTKTIEARRDTDVIFSESMRYDTHQMPGSVSQYSGNISEIETVQYGNPKDIYAYSYDGLSRLTDASHFIGGPLGASNTNTERLMEYDLNGNLLWIQRCGATPSSFENLEFTYNGNRLTGAKDWRSGVNNTYSYDLNGNRTVDGRTGLEFTYNLLNLPCDINEIQWDMEAGMYQYWSDGTKKRGQDSDGDGHRYAGSFSYETDCGEDTGRFSVAWDEGRTYVSYSGAVSDRWFVRDHLGNVRAVVDLSAPANADVDDVIVEQNDYLPFGTKAVRPTLATSSDNLYRYAGKEEQTLDYLETGLIDFGARYYDPWSCQWTAVDPMAEKCYGISAYNYCKNTPVNRVDPDGLTDYFNSSGAMVYRDLVNNGEIRVVTSNQAKDILEGYLSKGNIDDLTNGISQKLYESSETFTGALRSSTLSYDSALNIVNHYCETEVVIGDLKHPNENGNRGSFGSSYRGNIIADFDVIQTDGLKTRTQNGIIVSEEALYDNSNNIKSSVDDHERFHQNDPIIDNKREHRAYEYQVNAPGFKNTTSRFQFIMIERSKQYGN